MSSDFVNSLDSSKRLIASICDYLYENQCNLRQIEILPCCEQIKTVKFTRGGEVVAIHFEYSKRGLHWSVDGGNSGIARRDKLFRISIVKQKSIKNELSTRGFFKKLYSLKQRVIGILKHLQCAGFDNETNALLADFWRVLVRSPVDSSGGFLCRWGWRGENILVDVIDHGGIYDDNPNNEGMFVPARVMANYYADAYAAYLFCRQYLNSGDVLWLEACDDAMRFVVRSYEGYPIGVAWMHHEFKNLAFLEVCRLLEQAGVSRPEYFGFIDKLRCDSYEPTNVYALRFSWKCLVQELQGKRDGARIQKCIRRLEKDQTRDGLILDNNPPSYEHAHDLTYHQYSLACLATAIEFRSGTEVQKIFKKGCEFSRSMLLSNGEVSYNGRGANNIYHLAAALYSLAVYAKMFGTKLGFELQIPELLERHLRLDGSLPTALNAYGDSRMAWNHCRSPYNALSAYYLVKYVDILEGGLQFEQNEISRDAECYIRCPESGYFVDRRMSYEAVTFSGVDESYAYSFAHKTGVSGLAVVLPRAGEAMNLILDRYVASDYSILSSDLPIFYLRDQIVEPFGGEIDVTSSNGICWRKKCGEMDFSREYVFEETAIRFRNRLQLISGNEIESPTWLSFPLNLEAYEFEIVEDIVKLRSKDGYTRAKLVITNDCSVIVKWEQTPIKSNPRGKGVVLSCRLGPDVGRAGRFVESEMSLFFEN